MKISDFSISSFAKSEYKKEEQESLEVRVQKPELKAVKAQAKEEKKTDEIEVLDPKYLMIVLALEALTGEKIQVSSLHVNENKTSKESPQPHQSLAPIEKTSAALRYESMQKMSNSLHIGFSGDVVTEDGRNISFNMSVKYHEEFMHYSSLTLGDKSLFEDPLVISFDGNPPLHAEKFDFDLKPGVEELNFLNQNSAYLVYDKNKNGKVDDGSELFGPKSGDGYADLGEFDTDNNGWIDENDSVFKQLKLWHPVRDGDQNLLSLEEVGVGAISLQTQRLDFTTHEDIDVPIANHKDASVVLNEDGSSAMMFSVDLVV